MKTWALVWCTSIFLVTAVLSLCDVSSHDYVGDLSSEMVWRRGCANKAMCVRRKRVSVLLSQTCA
jgi:hypothetical protein